MIANRPEHRRCRRPQWPPCVSNPRPTPAKDADAARIADTIAAAWHQIDAVLDPIIGRRGVAALYHRSLHLTSPAHPWLAGTNAEVQSSVDLAPLESALARQSSMDAAAGGGAVLQAFHELLVTLIGPSLTEQLLGSVWADLLGGVLTQRSSP